MDSRQTSDYEVYKKTRGFLINVALGKEPADLVLSGGNIVCVDTREIYSADVAVKGNRIALVGDASHTIGPKTKVIDVKGKWISPGLMDAHMHVESSMLTVTEMARLLIPRGVTAIFADPHEIGNLFGIKGVRVMWEEAQQVPMHVYICPSSAVPTAMGLETSGAIIGPDQDAEMLDWDNVVALGEIMSPFVLAGYEDQQQKISNAIARGKIVNGHTEGIHGPSLNAFLAAGVQDSHNSFTIEEGLELLRLGAKAIILEGTIIKRLPSLARLITERGIDPRHILLCTDDMAPEDLYYNGQVDGIVRKAVKEGIDPIVAIQMGSLNCAEHYMLNRDQGSVVPGKLADLVVLDDLNTFKVNQVFIGGQLVAENDRMVVELKPFKYPTWMLDSVHISGKMKKDDFRYLTNTTSPKVNVRVMTAGVINKEIHEMLPVVSGEIMPDVKNDVLKMCVVERHTASGRIGRGFVKGFGLKRGAIGSSIAHNHHNLITVGTNDADIAAVINRLSEIKGGFVAVLDGKVVGETLMPIAGLLSEKRGSELLKDMDALNRCARELLGCSMPALFMELSFMGLPVVPELHISDLGLVSAAEFKIVPLEVE
jgi:adenine deaminase